MGGTGQPLHMCRSARTEVAGAIAQTGVAELTESLLHAYELLRGVIRSQPDPCNPLTHPTP